MTLTVVSCGGDREVVSASRYDVSVFSNELAPDVRRLFEYPSAQADMAYRYLGYANALVNDVDALDEFVAPDVQLHELTPLGLTGLAGLKEFRRQRNDSFSYDRRVVRAMRFPEPEIIEVDLCTERTDIAGMKRVIAVYARNRWVNDMLVERWDRSEELSTGSDCGAPPASRR